MSKLVIGQVVESVPIKKKRKRNYINNPDFHAALKEYKVACDKADSEQVIRPVIPNYIGECILLLSQRIATRKNFSRYPFLEDMIMDAVEICFKYIDRFNPDRYDNPHAYFSRVVWNVFLQRIDKEKKQLYIKFKSSQQAIGAGGVCEADYMNEVDVYTTSYDFEYMNRFIEEYERKMEEKKAKIKETKKKEE